VMVALTGTQNTGTLQIMDINGRVLKTTVTHGATTGIDMHGLPSGIYLIRYMDALRVKTIRISKE